MPEQNRDGGRERLFIKVILPRQAKERRVTGGGAPPKAFREVNQGFRQSLSTRIRTIDQAIKVSAKKIGGVPVRVKLIEKASAKSHRPEHLFTNRTCPIIGAGKLGELFVKATPDGLQQIDDFVLKNKSPQIVKELSTIDTIEPVSSGDRLYGLTPLDVLRFSPKFKGGFATKVQLFDFYNPEEQKKLVKDFEESCEKSKIKIDRQGYSENSQFYQAVCERVEQVEHLSKIVGVRSVKRMPVIKRIRTQLMNEQALPSGLPLPAGSSLEYPIVAVVDSGITNDLPVLNNWIIGRESTVPANYRNPRHGTFVAGLLCWAKELNPSLKYLDLQPCVVFDLQVIPNDDESVGDVDFLTESQLLQDLETSLKAHANEIRVWNFSMGSDEVCSLDSFSSLAIELDRLQEKYNVSFVISAGNYIEPPLLKYPRIADQLKNGRITSPADSVLGIAVGSVSHVSLTEECPKEGEPSPFSRHGAGPNHIIKPDLVHFGGTCDLDRKSISGIRSTVGAGTSESIGTSFSAPIVSRALANIYHNITPTPSTVLARAVLTHHARDPRTGGRVPDKEENFLGFGIPGNLTDCLECNPWTSTLVFEDTLRPGYYLEWDSFPYPTCLTKNGKYYGDIWMTVAFAPERDERWGTEYCETHIEAHFGVYYRKESRKTGSEKIIFKGLVPPEHKNPGVLYETYQVEKLRKWAPVRTYFGSLGKNGVRGDRWRLKVQLLSRHGVEEKENLKPQKFALIVTIADPTKTSSVYNDMSVNIRGRFQSENLTLRAATRVQTRQ